MMSDSLGERLTPDAWVRQGAAVAEQLSSGLPQTDARALRHAWRELVRIVHQRPHATIDMPLRLPAGLARQWSQQCHGHGLSRAVWQRAVERLWAGLEAARLGRRPGALRVRPQPRDTGICLTGEVFGALPTLQRLADALLTSGPLEPEQMLADEACVASAVLGTIVFSAITRADLCEVLPQLEADVLDLEHGQILLPSGFGQARTTPAVGPWERFSLDQRSRLFWGRLRLRRMLQQASDAGDAGLLPSLWREPGRLRASIGRRLNATGFPTWHGFLKTVRLAAALTMFAPVTVVRRAGHLRTTPAPANDWHRLGWSVPDELGQCVNPSSRPSPAARPGFAADCRSSLSMVVTRTKDEMSSAVRAKLATEVQRRGAAARGWTPWEGLILEWAIWLLRHPRVYRPATVRTWVSRLGRIVDTVPQPRIPDDIGSSDRLLAFLRAALDSAGSEESQRATRTTLRGLLTFMVSRGVSVAPVRWGSAALAIKREPRVRPLLSPGDVRRTVQVLLNANRDEGLALSAAVILAAFGGLRRSEICRLSLPDVAGDRSWTLRVRRTKTPAGRRILPLGLLVPPWARHIVEEYMRVRADYPNNPSAWLLTADGQPWDPDELGERLTRALRTVTATRATVHSLRRACATWMLVSWLHEHDAMPMLPGLHFTDAVNREGVQVTLGEDPDRVLWVLARLLGHASPEITLTRYMGAADWVEAHQVDSRSHPSIPLGAAAWWLQISARWARQRLAPRLGRVDIQDLVAVQRHRLEHRTHRSARLLRGGQP